MVAVFHPFNVTYDLGWVMVYCDWFAYPCSGGFFKFFIYVFAFVSAYHIAFHGYAFYADGVFSRVYDFEFWSHPLEAFLKFGHAVSLLFLNIAELTEANLTVEACRCVVCVEVVMQVLAVL